MGDPAMGLGQFLATLDVVRVRVLLEVHQHVGRALHAQATAALEASADRKSVV